ncbi:MAG: transporter substrate-binding domain-containing protein [Erysipelothrix sp.]|nr:transporter substrate-binding domain-containing protein [Erysipelothrix sp.]
MSDASFDSELYGIGFRKDEDDSLKDAIDAIIDELILSKEAQEISEKWLGKDMIKR